MQRFKSQFYCYCHSKVYIIGLLHWYRWILSQVGISKDASLRAISILHLCNISMISFFYGCYFAAKLVQKNNYLISNQFLMRKIRHSNFRIMNIAVMYWLHFTTVIKFEICYYFTNRHYWSKENVQFWYCVSILKISASLFLGFYRSLLII